MHNIKIFRIVLLLIILFGYGVGAYSNYSIEPIFMEQSTPTNNQENSIISDNDNFDDDQINQVIDFYSFVKFNSGITISQKCFQLQQASFSIWQPPQNN